MNLISLFIPVTILLIIFIIIIGLMKNNHLNGERKSLKGKHIKIFLISYVIFLFIGLIMYNFIPFKKYDKVTGIEDRQYNDIYSHLIEGNTDVLEKLDMGDQFTFKYDKDNLVLSLNSAENFGGSIFIHRKDTNDDVIIVTNYFHPVIIDYVKLTEEIPSVKTEITGSTMLLQIPQEINISIAKIKPEFIINQFLQKPWNFDIGFSLYGDNILYMEIPKELKIVAPIDMMNIQYID